ncbi:CoA-binding protein [Candidatus Woesearchaeota archaeon]|nr:CoA-binding protein [Candidatus Woesearchaeota archaeon]
MLPSKTTHVLVQGITGKEGSKATQQMLASGTLVTCGVTPGKGGKTIEGLPVFNTVAEAKVFDPLLTASVLYVPPLLAYQAAREALVAGIPWLVVFTENIPVRDTAKLIAYAAQHHSHIIGPSSVGLMHVGSCKFGSLGGGNDDRMYSKGHVGIMSKSGGMCAETALLLTKQGIGQSMVIGLGGDVLMGSTFTDLLPFFQQDQATKVLVIFGEVGGTAEEELAEAITSKRFTKPVVAFISGLFVESLPRNFPLGHAGAFIEGGRGKAEDKKKILREAGVLVAEYHHEIPDLVKKVMPHGI